ncbi:hypothetical protein HDV03_004596 [Kappamyces sp. JEL0829]|nr:hypothetical protein HDV03_004596 [Kappamyces sp. JEL0829]KAJ3360409.1 hypothetical protein HDU91_004628 [Kappamyces sp. JEL0680]
MTSTLPPHLLRLFAPRPPLGYLPPSDKDPQCKKLPRFDGLASFLHKIPDFDKDYVATETMIEKKAREETEKKAEIAARQKKIATEWEPSSYKSATSDPYKTLFISNLVKIVKDRQGKPKGYAFVEFERESAMKLAYKEAEGLKLNGRRLLVDVERGRTVKDWKPKKLGGGLGKKRVGGAPKPRHRMHDRPYNGGNRGSGSFRGRDDRGPRDDYRGGGSFRGRDDRGPRDDFRGGRGGFSGPPRGGLGFRDRDRDGGRHERDDRRGGSFRDDRRGYDRDRRDR